MTRLFVSTSVKDLQWRQSLQTLVVYSTNLDQGCSHKIYIGGTLVTILTLCKPRSYTNFLCSIRRQLAVRRCCKSPGVVKRQSSQKLVLKWCLETLKQLISSYSEGLLHPPFCFEILFSLTSSVKPSQWTVIDQL